MKVGSGAFERRYSFASRFENGTGTNPEELIAAAEAGCFSMALSLGLSHAAYSPKRISTTGKIYIEKVSDGFKITSIDLHTEAEVLGIDEPTFVKQAEATKKTCPVSLALTGTVINLQGSAMPLVWAQAEYVKLCRSLSEGQTFDTPPQTIERYVIKQTGSPYSIWRFNNKCVVMLSETFYKSSSWLKRASIGAATSGICSRY
ncbi:MAG TPA: OsmC family peroxiredoxin [Pyrinomonadaceae bacterium]